MLLSNFKMTFDSRPKHVEEWNEKEVIYLQLAHISPE